MEFKMKVGYLGFKLKVIIEVEHAPKNGTIMQEEDCREEQGDAEKTGK